MRRPHLAVRWGTMLAFVAGAVASVAAPARALAPTRVDPSGKCALPFASTEGPTNWGTYLRPSGPVTAIMLFVDFPDAAAEGDLSDYSGLFLPKAPQWFADASYGRVSLSVTTVDAWIHMPNASTSYPGWGPERNVSFETQRHYIEDAMHAAVVQQGVSFDGFGLIYVVPTTAATAISYSPAFIANPGDGAATDGYEMDHAATFGQDMWSWGFKVLNHETGHTFGLPDLYAAHGDTHRFVGGWDLMGHISGNAPEYLGIHKWKLGWLRAAQVICRNAVGPSDVRLTPIEIAGGAKLLVLRTGTDTAVMVEDRRAVGHDAHACSAGALIYKVDSSVGSAFGPVRVRNSHPSFGGTARCDPIDRATFGIGPGQVSVFRDRPDGIVIRVTGITAAGDVKLHVSRTTAYEGAGGGFTASLAASSSRESINPDVPAVRSVPLPGS